MSRVLRLLRSAALGASALCLLAAASCAFSGAMEWRQTARWPQQSVASFVGVYQVHVDRWPGAEIVLERLINMSASLSLAVAAMVLFLLAGMVPPSTR